MIMIEEAKFYKWIKKNHVRIFKPEKYYSTLKTISKDLSSKSNQKIDLLRLDNSETAKKFKEQYFSYSEFEQKNKTGNNMYSRSFDLLIDYLKDVTVSTIRLVIQPIGNENSVEDFFIHNRDRWAEKTIHRKKWERSLNSIVLFAHKGNFFAKAFITKIEESNDPDYPLDYYYDNLIEMHNINYKKIIELSEHHLNAFQTYTILDEIHSEKVLHYLNSLDVYVDEVNADEMIQNQISQVDMIELEEKPIPAKVAIEKNGRKVYPRNLTHAKKALDNADYKCEVDLNHETFISKSSGKQYVEAHHLIPMKAQGDFEYSIDVPANIISLCPTCHRRLHHSSMEDKLQLLEMLLSTKKSKLAIFGINMDVDDLKLYYS